MTADPASGPRGDTSASIDTEPTDDAPATDDTYAGRLARYYDLDLEDDPGDLDLYLALAERAAGPVLELACGTGRLAVPLALAGHEVVGVDLDAAMLTRARDAWRRAEPDPDDSLELVEDDLLDVSLGARFSLAFLALNTLMLLREPARQAAAVAALARHLRPGGLAVVDVWLPGVDDLALYDGRVVTEWRREDPETREIVVKSSSARHDAATATVDLHSTYDAWPSSGGPVRRVDRLDALRLVSADELVRFAADAGLAVDVLAGDYELEPFGRGAPRAVLVATLL